MKVNNKFKVNWAYKGCNEIIGRNKMGGAKIAATPMPCETTCNISEITGDTENPYKELLSVTIRKHHLDRFDKKVARKVSFTRAISNFSKELRREFWEAYLQNIKL